VTSLKIALQALCDRDGELTPRAVVEAARDQSSPLHAHIFHVPVEEAAERYYLDRASRLIRKYRIIYRSPGGESGRVRAYVSTMSETGPVYRPTEDVLADDFQRALLLQSLKRDIKTLKAKYGHLEEFTAIVLTELREHAS
jgi:hypothetical protein